MELDRDALELLDRAALIGLVLAQQGRLAALEARVAELTERLGDEAPPAPPVAPGPRPRRQRAVRAVAAPPPRKRRAQNYARRREAPTRVVEHAVAACPDCGTALAGGEVVRRRQVLHVPRVRVEVIEHVVRRRTCPGCGRCHTPTPDLSAAVLGHRRISLETMAYVASLRAVARLPVRTIQWLLATLHGLRLSVGAIVGLCRAVAARAKPALAALREQVRASPAVNADETGWRENGRGGHVWTFSTPTLRYFHHDRSRAGAVVQDVLGPVYEGVLVSDFYGAYNVHDGPHQRCWPHLLRDVHDLRLARPDGAALAEWAAAVHALYAEAKAVAARALPWPQRVAARARLDNALLALCAPGLAPGSGLPHATLCQRIDRFLDELFEFVLDPAVPSDNNLAERSLRPLVVARKISGGTRSKQGSQTRMALASLFATWQAQERDPFLACRQMLLTQAL